MNPGATQFTLTLNGPSSIASVLRHALQAGLRGRVVRLAAVAERRGGRDQHHLPALLLDHVPLRSPDRVGTSRCRCVSMTASQSSSVILKSRLSRMIPAHVTSMSSEPPRSTAASTARLDVRALRHVAAHRVAADLLRRLRAPPPRRSRRRRRVAPSAASRRAVAAPMPFAPPVTDGRLPFESRHAADDIRCRAWSSARSSAGAGCTARSCPTRFRASRSSASSGVIRRAPSGGFSQGGSIVVVTDDDKRAGDRARVRRRALLARRAATSSPTRRCTS